MFDDGMMRFTCFVGLVCAGVIWASAQGAFAAGGVPDEPTGVQIALAPTDGNQPGGPHGAFEPRAASIVDVLSTGRDALEAKFRKEGGVGDRAPITPAVYSAGAIPQRQQGQPDPIADLELLLKTDAATASALKAAIDQALSAALHTEGPSAIDVAHINRLKSTAGDAQWRCLSEALYFEARGESMRGQVAVAEVILNRVEHKRYPGTICGVVQQGSHRRNACQFSFTCDGKPEHITNRRSFERVGKIARLMIDLRPRPLTGGATHYHNLSVTPSWSRKLTHTATIGSHIFYRLPIRVSSN